MHQKPVMAGLAKRAVDWRGSSAQWSEERKSVRVSIGGVEVAEWPVGNSCRRNTQAHPPVASQHGRPWRQCDPANGSHAEKIDELEPRIHEEEKAASEALAKLDAIDAAVFDFRAVKPNAVVKLDERTPEEAICSVEDQGKIVADALSMLRKLISNGKP